MNLKFNEKDWEKSLGKNLLEDEKKSEEKH